MTSKEELKSALQRKHLLLDTGVISRAFDHFPVFKRELFDVVVEVDCQMAYIPPIEFELLRHAVDPEHRKARTDFLAELTTVKLPISAEQAAQFSAENNY